MRKTQVSKSARCVFLLLTVCGFVFLWLIINILIPLMFFSLAYTGSSIGMHVDLPYYKKSPSVSNSSLMITIVVFNFIHFSTHLLKSSYLSAFYHISSQYLWFTSQIWYDYLLFWKLIRFRIFPGFFPYFPRIFPDLKKKFMYDHISCHYGYFVLKFTMMILFSGNCSCFQILPVFPDFL